MVGLVREIDTAVQQQIEGDIKLVMEDLRGLHAALESGRMTEEEFDLLESASLDRLKVLKGMHR